jgi:hypothetical protein
MILLYLKHQKDLFMRIYFKRNLIKRTLSKILVNSYIIYVRLIYTNGFFLINCIGLLK